MWQHREATAFSTGAFSRVWKFVLRSVISREVGIELRMCINHEARCARAVKRHVVRKTADCDAGAHAAILNKALSQ